MRKVVTQFVPIAAVKTVEVHTPDLKKHTSPKIIFKNYFQALSADARVIFEVMRKLLEPIGLSYSSPSQVFFLRPVNHSETLDFCLGLCGKLLVRIFSPSRFLPHNFLLDPF